MGGVLFAEKQARELPSSGNSRVLRKAAQRVHAATAPKPRASAELRRRQIADLKEVLAQVETRNKTLAAEPAKPSSPESPEPGGRGSGVEGKTDQPQDFGSMMQKMFTDPEMKKVMKSQQTMAMQMMYGDLRRNSELSAEESPHGDGSARRAADGDRGKKHEDVCGGERDDGGTAEALREGRAGEHGMITTNSSRSCSARNVTRTFSELRADDRRPHADSRNTSRPLPRVAFRLKDNQSQGSARRS